MRTGLDQVAGSCHWFVFSTNEVEGSFGYGSTGGLWVWYDSMDAGNYVYMIGLWEGSLTKLVPLSVL